jgi:chemotaxis protein methyltransferase CheR
MPAGETAVRGEELTDALFKKIVRYVYEQSRINLTENKRELVRARLGKVIRTRGFKGYRDYYEYMIRDESGEAVREVLNAISTNLTSFFRENQHFEFLLGELFPKLLREKEKRGESRIRGWSAGSSSGEEVYTIAITLLESLADHGGRWDAKLLATDIDTTMLERGQRGVYDQDRVKTVPPTLLRRHFLRGEGASKGEYRVRSEARRLVSFRHLNLMKPWPFRGPFDFIFCRNVMIYFDRPTQEELVNRFYDVLGPGGHLFIGHSEGLSGIQHRFRYVKPTIYSRDG